MAYETITATEFKAKCLDILDRVGDHTIEQVQITKRGKVVAVLVPPPIETDAVSDLYGFMAGSVIIPEGFDLTEPVLDEPLDAERGILHR
jgi:prevent-host-death family protein